MRKKGILVKLFSSTTKKGIALFLLISFTTQLVYPTCAWALTGGPSQPEVQSFEPVGTSDMVDIFSGDFTYNIPLLDIDGYPINMSYHSGVGMDDEASWIGLGWNINAGVINRGVRGVPDDFAGDNIVKDINIKPNRTFGVSSAFGAELFGFDLKGSKLTGDSLKINFNLSLGINYNNYRGIGIDFGFGIGLKVGAPGKYAANANLGISSSSENGLSISPSLSFDHKIKDTETKSSKGSASLGVSVGTSINSRAGMKQLSISTSANSKVGDQTECAAEEAHSDSYSAGASFIGTASTFNFGSATYTPTGGPDMNNLSITANFKFGGELFGLDGTFDLSGHYSQQKLSESNIITPAFGYMNHEQGLAYSSFKHVLDFNRENEGNFSEHTPALPISQMTFDTYGVSGQGVGGSYRPVRSDVSYVFDSPTRTTSTGFDVGIELGIGGTNHNGTDLTVTTNNSNSGLWEDGNLAKSYLTAKASNGNSTYEKYYFKEANEKTIGGDEFYNKYAEKYPIRVQLVDNGDFNVTTGKYFQASTGGYYSIASNTRTNREKRNQVIFPLTKKEVTKGMGLNTLPATSYAASAPDHHIAEITTYSTDGMRYVYGLPAYNTGQEEVTFSVGARPNKSDVVSYDCLKGLITYGTFQDENDRSLNNKHGVDNYYSSTRTPAYAHSYLLTSVLSPDYIDADAIQGPSEGDLGYYTKFIYNKAVDAYKWRTPYTATAMQASYNEGIKTDKTDDKASILYGEKELWYLDTIRSKNYIAVFQTSDRLDGYEANGIDGGIGTRTTKKLDKISLFSIHDFKTNGVNAVPLKEVHFVYDYSLCPGIPNNPTGGGKLTLKEVFFTYQNSNKAKFSSYKFNYGGLNPAYAYKGYDRWGNYKPVPSTGTCEAFGDLIPSEFPYVEQNQATADSYTSAWHLTDIKLPSGGKIKVNYESDDYAYVQNKKAMQMFTIAGYGSDFAAGISSSEPNISAPGQKIYFNLHNGVTDITEYINPNQLIYFRFLMETNNLEHDYVSGYFRVAYDPFLETYKMGTETVGSTLYGYVIPQSVTIKDNPSSDPINPITKAAMQYCRLNIPQLIYNQPSISDSDGFGESLLNALVDVVSNFVQAIKGENQWLLDKGKCETALLSKSWIRLINPDEKKLGGGCRVKSIQMVDEWDAMTDNQMSKADYGQEYFYDESGTGNGASSGVASYEPQIGGDENPWKQPIFTHEKNVLAPDNEHYMEEPFGETMFPGASVGYGKVTVRNLSRPDVARHATGKVVHEFFTAKDFPVIVEKTGIDPIQHKTDPFSLTSLFYIRSKDFMTASQGFYVELNDMHGKPRKQSVYQESGTEPITSVEYKYLSEPYLAGSSRLKNKVQVVEPNGTLSNKNIGLVVDITTDFREQKTILNSVATQLNLDGFIWPFPPVYIPWLMALPKLTREVTQFRSASTTKMVQRFGILEETIAKDLGSVVSTKNKAYDSETGDVLLTQTVTDFNDAVYSMTYPAHWYYDGMGQAYKNIGLSFEGIMFDASGKADIIDAYKYFTPGDEVEFIWGGTLENHTKGWIVNVGTNTINIAYKSGAPITGMADKLKVIRSGRKNMQSVPIENTTSLSDPLANFTSNAFESVLQASAIEFSDRWRTFCDCFDDLSSPLTYSTNPYILGTRGYWRMKTSFLHLSPRTQSYNEGNTNIRKDGLFTSFTPYYKLNAGKWQVDEKNWTFTSEVTEFSPFGQELENRDALGRYSAATFGYRQTFATSVAANAKYSDIGFDNFEDYGFSKCADQHFKFPVTTQIHNQESHSGRNSLKLASGQSLIMKKALEICTAVGCDLVISSTSTGTGMNISISGGMEPYQVDWNVISGNPVIQFTGTGFSSINANGTNWVLELIVLDAQGCKTTKVITKN